VNGVTSPGVQDALAIPGIAGAYRSSPAVPRAAT
jgi:hypothetical protein